ncbi:MAG: serpin family protein [Bacteroidales bacterium]
MMKTTINIFLIMCGFCLLSSCDKTQSPSDETIKHPITIQLNLSETKMAEADKSFAMDFFSLVYEQNVNGAKKENIMVSPFSLSTALAMVWNGASGETKTAIQNVMGFQNYTDTELNGYYKKMKESLLSTDPSVKLAIANSIWYRSGITVNDVFVQTNKTWYNAQVKALDFTSPDAVKTINKWCSDNTNGLIKEVLQEISPYDLMYLLNALYFKGEWSKGYAFKESETKSGLFKKEDGTNVSVNMMNNKKELLYYTDETLSAVNLPYGNGAFGMILMLPQANVSLTKMLAQLKSPMYWQNMLKNRVKKEVSMQIPKFKIEYKDNLNEILKQMGMAVAFNSDLADFSRIFPQLKSYISTVDQFTYIDISEKGTEAAAVTVIGIKNTSYTPPVDFIANRPFLFVICEESTGCVLFMGMVGNPA